MNKYLVLGLAMLASSPIYCADGWGSDCNPLNDKDFALQFLRSGNAEQDHLDYCIAEHEWSPAEVTELLKYIPAICSACDLQERGYIACPNPECVEVYCPFCVEQKGWLDRRVKGCNYCLWPSSIVELLAYDSRDLDSTIDSLTYDPLNPDDPPVGIVDFESSGLSAAAH